jgi:hypothetical protein
MALFPVISGDRLAILEKPCTVEQLLNAVAAGLSATANAAL